MKKQKKDFSKKDLEWLEFIVNIKWEDGYRCRKCGNTNYSIGKTPFARKCTRSACKHEESATANTVLHGLKFPVEKAVIILQQLFYMYEEYIDMINDDVNKHLLEMYRYNVPFRVRKTNIRASPARIAKLLNMHERTVYLFLQRFMRALPEFEPTRYISAQWFRGVRYEDRDRYANLFYAIDSTDDVYALLRICVRGFPSEEDGY